jgi:AcrR family transcriptional regulator
MHTVEKREEILQSALEVISVHGFHGAPMSMIAEQAQVAMGTIYRFFPSKECLIHELYKALEIRFQKAVSEGLPVHRPVRERFFHIGRFFIRYCLASPLDFRFLEQFQNSPFGAAYRRDRILGNGDAGFLHDVLAEAQQEQILKPLPMAVLCALIFGPLICLIRDHVLGFIRLDEPLVEETIAACWDAIRS